MAIDVLSADPMPRPARSSRPSVLGVPEVPRGAAREEADALLAELLRRWPGRSPVSWPEGGGWPDRLAGRSSPPAWRSVRLSIGDEIRSAGRLLAHLAWTADRQCGSVIARPGPPETGLLRPSGSRSGPGRRGRCVPRPCRCPSPCVGQDQRCNSTGPLLVLMCWRSPPRRSYRRRPVQDRIDSSRYRGGRATVLVLR
jgi:hypothetical protein